MKQLIRYDAMCRAIDAAYRVDEVKGIRDKALAIEIYARQAKNKEAEQKAERIRLRAEHKVGQLLAQMEKAKGARGNPGGRGARIVRSTGDTAQTQTLAELGISKQQSSRWQAIGGISHDTFARALASPKPTVAVNVIVKRDRRADRERGMAAATIKASQSLGRELYGVIYADPGTQFAPWSADTGMDRAAENHYTTTALEQLKAMPWPAAPVCRLYLWATVPLLPQMLDLMAAQGFAYSSHIVWVKATLDGTKIKTGTGYETFNAHELLLIGDNSPDVPSPAPGQQPVSVIFAPRGAHSEKPEVFAEMIAQAFPEVPKVELFARRSRPGWAVWGDEVIEEVEAVA